MTKLFLSARDLNSLLAIFTHPMLLISYYLIFQQKYMLFIYRQNSLIIFFIYLIDFFRKNKERGDSLSHLPSPHLKTIKYQTSIIVVAFWIIRINSAIPVITVMPYTAILSFLLSEVSTSITASSSHFFSFNAS